jgi:hypothetical protein
VTGGLWYGRLVSVLDDIATDSPQGARRVQMRIQASIELLSLYSGIDTRTNDPTIRLIYADRAPLWRRQYRIIFLDKFLSFVFLSVYVRRRPPNHNHGRRSAPGQRGPPRRPRPRRQPRPQTDRLRQATRRHGPAARCGPRFFSLRQTLRHHRPRGHPRPHHQWPAPRRGPGNHTLASRCPRPGPHAAAHPPASRTRAARRRAVSTAGRPARIPARQPPRRPARLPTEAEIVAAVRRRPVGAVIVDICRDLGITPGQLDRAFWDELSHAIIAYGGSLAGFLGNLNRRLFAFGSGDHSDHAGPLWSAAPPRPAASATGPP